MSAGNREAIRTAAWIEDEHAQEFAGQKPEPFTVPGARAFPPQPAYEAETIPLQFGSAKVDLHFVEVLTAPVGSAALVDVYRVLGSTRSISSASTRSTTKT